MKHSRLTAAVIVIIAAVVTIAVLINSREWISKYVFMQSGKNLAAKLNSEQQRKYANDLQYTLKKFWQFYERRIVSREDLNDVMEKMKTLREKKDLTNMDIFDFIGYVSRLYTEAMNRHHRETFPE